MVDNTTDLKHVRRYLCQRAKEILPDSDALAVEVVLDLATDDDLAMLSDRRRQNVGTGDKPKYKNKTVFLIKPNVGVYYVDSAVQVLLEQARSESLVV